MSKKILILGASSDIGFETVKYFLKKNWTVTAHYNTSKKKLSQLGKRKNLKLLKFNLIKIHLFEKFIRKNSNEISNYDAFVSLTGHMKLKKFHKILPSDLIDHFNVNYISNLLIIQKILDKMKKKSGAGYYLHRALEQNLVEAISQCHILYQNISMNFFPLFIKIITNII